MSCCIANNYKHRAMRGKAKYSSMRAFDSTTITCHHNEVSQTEKLRYHTHLHELLISALHKLLCAATPDANMQLFYCLAGHGAQAGPGQAAGRTCICPPGRCRLLTCRPQASTCSCDSSFWSMGTPPPTSCLHLWLPLRRRLPSMPMR